jgi:tetratricopeptide (TPR) repeat protein
MKGPEALRVPGRRLVAVTPAILGVLAAIAFAPLLGSVADTASAQSMRSRVYEKLSRAETLAGQEDFEEALDQLEDVEKMGDLSDYEKAQLHTAYGFIHFRQENYRESIRAYEQVLAQKDLPEAMERGTLYTIAQLLFQVEEYEKSIAYLERWLGGATDPGPEPYVLLGQTYYQLERYESAAEAVERAIAIAAAGGRRIEENWYLLLRVFWYELGDYSRVLEILETLVREYPKKQYWLQLAAMYGELGEESKRLSAYEIAYLQGYLERGQEIVLLSQLLLQGDIPYRAGVVLRKGLADGLVEETAESYRLLSQAWTLAHEDRYAIDALVRAAELSDDGELDARLAQSYSNLNEWEDAVSAARAALKKGVEDEDQLHVLLGMALFELDRHDEAKSEFRAALLSPESRETASQWIAYIEKEQQRLTELQRSLGR